MTITAHSLTIIQCLFVGPVGPLLHVLKMRVLLTQARVEHRNLHTGPLAYTRGKHAISSNTPLKPKASCQAARQWRCYRPVCPICQRTSAWRIWATWRGMARSRRLLEWRPVACQNPEPSDKLVRRNGRDDCHDCHFCVPRVALQGEQGSGAAETRDKRCSKTLARGQNRNMANVLLLPAQPFSPSSNFTFSMQI